MKFSKSTFINLIVTTSLALTTLLCSFVVYGWFSTSWSDETRNIQFRAGETKLPDTKIFMYLTQEEIMYLTQEEIPTDDTRTEGWETFTLKEKEESEIGKYFAGVKDTNGNSYDSGKTTTFQYMLPSVHIGAVDNLGFIKNDNKLYFRFEITPTKHGSCITINADFYRDLENSVYSVDLIDENNNVVTVDKPLEAGSTESMIEYLDNLNSTEGSELIQFKYAISTEALAPTTDDTNDLDDDGINDDFAKLEFLPIPKGEGVKAENQTQNYYVFIEITPNLESITKIVDYIYNCLFLFKINIELTTYTALPGEEVGE